MLRKPQDAFSASCSPRAATGAREPEALAQRRPRVLAVKQPAPLQLRHHEPDEVLVRAGHMRRPETKPAQRPAGEPLLEPVGDLGRTADEDRHLAQGPAAAVLD